jgi:hypothetical protein
MNQKCEVFWVLEANVWISQVTLQTPRDDSNFKPNRSIAVGFSDWLGSVFEVEKPNHWLSIRIPHRKFHVEICGLIDDGWTYGYGHTSLNTRELSLHLLRLSLHPRSLRCKSVSNDNKFVVSQHVSYRKLVSCQTHLITARTKQIERYLISNVKSEVESSFESWCSLKSEH